MSICDNIAKIIFINAFRDQIKKFTNNNNNFDRINKHRFFNNVNKHRFMINSLKLKSEFIRLPKPAITTTILSI